MAAQRFPFFGNQYFWIRLCLTVAILGCQVISPFVPPAVAAPNNDVGQTIEDFLSLGANTVREIDKAIQQAGYEVRATLQQLQAQILAVMEQLSKTYQDNLNVTIDSLDGFTRNKLRELQVQMEKVNAEIQKDIKLASAEAKTVIDEAARQVRRSAVELEESLKNVILIGGETVSYVVDRAIYNAILVVSLVLLGLGLLLFVFLLFTRKMPSGMARSLLLGFMALFLALFGALALVPPVRGYAMAYTGIGLEARLSKVASSPRITDLVPDTIILGETKEVEIWGSALIYKGKDPEAWIDEINVPISASSPHHVVVNTLNLPNIEGSHNLRLVYGEEEQAREVVHFKIPTPVPQPADIVVTAFSILPEQPVEKQSATAKISVKNQGQGAAGKFYVYWYPISSDSTTVQSRIVNGLGINQAANLSMDYPYKAAGNYSTRVEIDPLDEVAESDEGNNTNSFDITVKPLPPPQTIIQITGNVHITDDESWPFSNETGDLPVNDSDFFIPGQNHEYHYGKCVGGEVRVAIHIYSLVPKSDLTALINGTAFLYEGDSCNTNDEEDRQNFAFIVPANGKPVVWKYLLQSTGTGGGDKADIILTFTSTAQ